MIFLCLFKKTLLYAAIFFDKNFMMYLTAKNVSYFNEILFQNDLHDMLCCSLSIIFIATKDLSY